MVKLSMVNGGLADLTDTVETKNNYINEKKNKKLIVKLWVIRSKVEMETAKNIC